MGMDPLRRILAAIFLFCAALLPASAADKRFVILLIGPTGSGKTTQAEFIKKRFGISTISVDDLIHDHREALAKLDTPGIDPGPPQASDALNGLVRDACKKLDLTKGVVLDGYPATKEQADYLADLVRKLELPPPIVIQLEVPDDVVRERLKKRARADDKPDLIEGRLKTYHRELDMIRDYYPQANIWTIDGTKSVRNVSQTIEAILTDEIPKK
jgi:adenylate kinase